MCNDAPERFLKSFLSDRLGLNGKLEVSCLKSVYAHLNLIHHLYLWFVIQLLPVINH